MKEKFSISFKNNEKEQAVKEYLNEKFNPTAYIKELIYKDMMGQTTSVKDIFDKVALEEVKNMPRITLDTGIVSDDDIEKFKEDMRKASIVPIEPKEEKAFGFDPSVRPVF